MNRESWLKIEQYSSLPTPYYLFNGALFRGDAKALYTGLCKYLPTIQINYSTKTNHLPACLNMAQELGFYFEVVGPEDLATCLKLAIRAERISLGGPSWSKEVVSHAVNAGVGQFICDSSSNAQLLWDSSQKSKGPNLFKVGFRVHEGESHFGFSPTDPELRVWAEKFREAGFSQLGLHLHRNPGGSVSSIDDLKVDFQSRAKTLADIAAHFPKVSFFNLGGGIDSPWIYRVSPHDLGDFHNPNSAPKLRAKMGDIPRFSLEEAGSAIGKVIQESILSKFPEAQIQLEPGRALCTRALSAVLSVTAVKKNFYPDHQVLITNGSTSALGPLHRSAHPVSAKQEGRLSTFVYGQLPHSGDWLFQNIPLPEMKVGDKLLVENTGAYFLAMESNFGFPLLRIFDSETGRELHRR